ncbi:hypothetical protein APY04_3507 [Hyphomicrobium sulfonivorans]|uniref:Uncharacterized protein n=1 Tax=Hyphomicrobium sulfonivorans TaxID=121290 RepID=A0A120CT75_HYPSL|nr:hypothetical protein APY04_3507 [Hyphomicrobium sulfonivorans]
MIVAFVPVMLAPTPVEFNAGILTVEIVEPGTMVIVWPAVAEHVVF